MTQITLDHVTKYYDALEDVTLTGFNKDPALKDVSMVVNDGEAISIVGPSGCGKSTLLKVIAGLENPQRGRILYDGADMTPIRTQDRQVGMVFQDYALYPAMKGKGNLQYYFEQHHQDEGEAEQRVRQVAQMMGVGFDLLLGRLPDTLSGGEKQRVAIARCIIGDPSVFLMDEPIVNLDAKLREATRIEIKKLLRKFKITTFYVTHDQQEAIFMGDRVAVMRAGILEQMGTFDELYYTPANLFVATFIGAPPMNILPVALTPQSVQLAPDQWARPALLAHIGVRDQVRLGVRPEGWRFVREDEGIPLTVSHVERIPTEQIAVIHGTLGGAFVTAIAPLGMKLCATLAVVPDWERAYLFEATGEAPLLTPTIPDLF